MAFQVVKLEIDKGGRVVSRRPLQPLYALHQHAMAMAEFDAAHCWGEYGNDLANECWWASDENGRSFRFEIQEVAATDFDT